ncbi:TPA: recombination protein RecR [Candidatus Dependentiae bacterium]|nr:MAG: Recombination protein RecR [candidate division TM6 bacterium GW2011_GWF2_36_131]KKQ02811.1 MAG: Recombination protein RecR [candidate division TM6 bacterium GW2011_GWE2_36_25]KKQ18981.1 MAG: Recombination protein RecR [candidate division TM6 bacterium GW2011_GWA2_36_9]HBR70990.1 recombination protein RecR [Candidatus Dependentiae bacterium]HCU00247.1 recombination protein RecR [Candidatus Dependentiae bacterium]
MNVLDQLPSLNKLIRQLQKVPYLASKNLYRVATHFLQMSDEQMKEFCSLLLHAQQQIVKCPICWAWQEKDGSCQFCASARRDKTLICIVASWQDILAIEKSGAFNGLYHVLGGVLSPLDGIGAEQLSIALLIKRLENIRELIFAFNQTPEGETTAAYIADKISDKNIKITCLAQGMPVGSSLEFMDRLTLYKAVAQRKEF